MITSVNNPKIKDLVRLHQAKYRKSTGKFLIENEHLIQEALDTGYLEEVFVIEGQAFEFERQTQITVEVAKKLAQTQSVPQIIGVASKPQADDFKGNILFLEDLQDPGNVGTLLRSALSFGYQTVVLSPKSVDFTNDKVVRSSQGALFHLNMMEMSLPLFTKKAFQQGYQILGSVVSSGTSVRSLSVDKHALLLGNEGQGLSPQAIQASQILISIPTVAFESLNVAIAGSIMMYELNES